MTESTKIEFRYRRLSQLDDITDLVAVFFPGNQNQQHAAARILLALKSADGPVDSLSDLQQRINISRRTLQRTRAKLARLGLIERVTWMNSRYGGQQGWVLSSRMSSALRLLADKLDAWRSDDRSERREKDERLAGLLEGPMHSSTADAQRATRVPDSLNVTGRPNRFSRKLGDRASPGRLV